MNEQKTPKIIEFFHKFFITGVFSGYLPIAPGSWGSLLACIILWFTWPALWYYQLLIIFLFYPIAVYFADGRPIVIDEIIGQMIALFMAPHNIIAYVLGFLLFRVFDIIKPQPARKFEKIHGGTGVVADDIAAGVYALIVLQLIITLFRRWGAGWI